MSSTRSKNVDLYEGIAEEVKAAAARIRAEADLEANARRSRAAAANEAPSTEE